MAETVKRPEKTHSEGFRRFATDTFGLRVSNNFAQINFSIETQNAQDEDCLVVEATAVMTLVSMKILHKLLGSSLNVIEAQFGTIQLPPGKEEELEKKWAALLEAQIPKKE